jgi:magnesium transporter
MAPLPTRSEPHSHAAPPAAGQRRRAAEPPTGLGSRSRSITEPATASAANGGTIRVATHVDGQVKEWTGEAAFDAIAALEPLDVRRRDGDRREPCVWIDLTDPRPELVERIARSLRLHPLIAEDILEGNQRGKIEVTDGLVHLVLFVLSYGDPRGVAHEIDLVLGEGFLLTSHSDAWDPRAGLHAREGVGPMLRSGPDHVLWALFDDIVDSYFPYADRLEEVVDRLQDAVVDRPDRQTLEELFSLKRDLIAARRAVSPVREVLNQLTNREVALIDPAELVYFRDIYDHVIRLTEELDTDRELVAATVEIYLSTINNNLSTIMKRLTGVTVILAGAGAVAGIFGMSEASLAFSGSEAGGFWLVTAVIVALTVVAAVILRRIDWI